MIQLLRDTEQLIAAATTGGGLSYPQKKRVEELTRLILNAEVRKCNCTDRFLDALFMCRKQLKTYGVMKTPCKYKLKNNVVLQFQNNVYTNANLTDEVAEAYLAKYPKTTYFVEKAVVEVSEKQVENSGPVKRSEGDDLTEAVESIKDMFSRGIGMMEIRERMKNFVFANGDTLAWRGVQEAIKIFKESVNETANENVNAEE